MFTSVFAARLLRHWEKYDRSSSSWKIMDLFVPLCVMWCGYAGTATLAILGMLGILQGYGFFVNK
jgi:hypothetical protein